MASDDRFRGFPDRFANRDALAEILDGEFRRATTGAWMQRLGGRVPAAPVLTLPQALDNPHFHATEGVLSLAHPQRPDLKMIAAPIRIDGRRPGATRGRRSARIPRRCLPRQGSMPRRSPACGPPGAI